ncbi:hypothetical protein [Novosphingobium sp. MBES04]|uniref:hypothetical protein n=1 Tax=Novosphingobium sp. MBES04 TaxID=1206458 RepID=UPI001185B7BB|nr:hypothetical protein [Novosphingobium sp. MBES04]
MADASGLALAISAGALLLAGHAQWRISRKEKLDRGRLEIIESRVMNLFHGGKPMLRITIKNVGPASLSITSAGISSWLHDGPEDEPQAIEVAKASHHLEAGEQRLVLHPVEVPPELLADVIERRTELRVAIYLAAHDAIGALSLTRAYRNIPGNVDMADRLEQLDPAPIVAALSV